MIMMRKDDDYDGDDNDDYIDQACTTKLKQDVLGLLFYGKKRRG